MQTESKRVRPKFSQLKLDLNHPALQPIKPELTTEPKEIYVAQSNVCNINANDYKDREVVEKSEFLHTYKSWIQKVEDFKTLPWKEYEASDHFFVWNKSDRVDPFHMFDWSKFHPGRLFKVSGKRDSKGRIHGKVEITFQNGEEVTGSFLHGQRNGVCFIRSRNKGIECLTGCWKNDRLEGFASCKYTDGSVAQGWIREGVWHGSFR